MDLKTAISGANALLKYTAGMKRNFGHRHPRALLLALSVWLFTVPAVPAQNQAYNVGTRDVLHVSIHAGGEKQSEVDLTVAADGTIKVPFIGTLPVSGLTTAQIEEQIRLPLAKDYFVDPEVHAAVKEYHALQYHIAGAVKSPGSYNMSTVATLIELIAEAGGVLPERGNVAYVQRGAPGDKPGEPIKVDLTRLLDRGDMSENLQLVSGDVVYIPPEKSQNLGESKVYVEGEVKKPGVYDFQPGMTALNACIMAGGFDKFAAPNRARVIRSENGRQQILRIDLEDVKNGKIPDVELKPGDRIHIPESYL